MTDRHPLFHRYPADNLLRASFLADQCFDLLPDLAAYAELYPVLTPQQRQIVDLPASVAPQTLIPTQLPANGLFITFQQLGNLCLTIFGFLQNINLLSFLLPGGEKSHNPTAACSLTDR